jgi:hypothetical protein
MLKKFMQAAAILALLTGTASAQFPMPGISLGGDKPPLTPEEQEKQKQIDNAYKSATKKIPEQKDASDPWSDVRAPTPAPAPKKKPQ